MTVVVGVLCEDGVVIGSDSSATFGAGGHKSIEQPARKTVVISDHMLMSGTGQVGLAQRFANILTAFRARNKFDQIDQFELSKGISATTIQDFGQTNATKGAFGALVVFQSSKGFHLCEFAQEDFQPEFKTSEMWFATMGSGQLIADPLLAMLRRVFFKHKQPRLNEGIFAVTWALLHAIELNPGGINGPAQIGVLRAVPPSKRMTAEMLGDDVLAEHCSNVEGIERHIAAYRETLSGQNAGSAIPSMSPKN